MIWAHICWPWPLWLSPQSEMLWGHTAFCVAFSMSATIATKNSPAQYDRVEILQLCGLIWLLTLFLYLLKWMGASLTLGFMKIFLVFWGLLIFIVVRLFLPFIHLRALWTSSPTALLFWGYSDICLRIDKTPVAIPTLDHPPSFPSWPLKMSDETIFLQLLHSALDAISGPRSEIRQHINQLSSSVSSLPSFHSLFFWVI